MCPVSLTSTIRVIESSLTASRRPARTSPALFTGMSSPAERGERADQRALPAFWRGHVGGNSREPS